MWSPEVFIGPELQVSICLPPFLLPSSLCLSAQASATAYHRLVGLNNKNLLSHSPRGWKSKINVLAGLGFCFWVLSSWLTDSPLLTVTSLGLSSVLMKRERESALVSPSSHENTSLIKSEFRFYDFVCAVLC